MSVKSFDVKTTDSIAEEMCNTSLIWKINKLHTIKKTSYGMKKTRKPKMMISNVCYKGTKRICDITLSVLFIIILMPFMLIIGIIIKLDSKGPVIFKHNRIGKNGKIIGLYKFRTMKPNAEELIKQFTPEQMKEYKTTFKITNDPRITKIGNILSKTSLDELPQLFNILKGDISIVGPKPIIKDEIVKYREYKDILLSVTPGLTGYLSISLFENPNTFLTVREVA